MQIAILGTGQVGRQLASALVAQGYQVRLGSRTADNPTAAAWVAESGTNASAGTFADAAAWGEVAFAALSG